MRRRLTGGRWKAQGLVFDYYVDEAAVAMVSWEARVPAFAYAPDASAAVFMPTMETARLTYLLAYAGRAPAPRHVRRQHRRARPDLMRLQVEK